MVGSRKARGNDRNDKHEKRPDKKTKTFHRPVKKAVQDAKNTAFIYQQLVALLFGCFARARRRKKVRHRRQKLPCFAVVSEVGGQKHFAERLLQKRGQMDSCKSQEAETKRE